WRTRAYGDFWSHVLVAEGAVDVCAEPEVSLWDLAALMVIVEEAGGTFTDLSGRRTPDGGSAVSTNGLLHPEVLALLGQGRQIIQPAAGHVLSGAGPQVFRPRPAHQAARPARQRSCRARGHHPCW